MMSAGLPENLAAEGWKQEERLVNGGRLVRSAIYRGDHHAGCLQTDDGWLCAEGCEVEDMRAVADMFVVIDDLISILTSTQRRGLRVHWSASRQSVRRRFRNGRCKLPSDEHIDTEVWHQGRTWTKRGAVRQLLKLGIL